MTPEERAALAMSNQFKDEVFDPQAYVMIEAVMAKTIAEAENVAVANERVRCANLVKDDLPWIGIGSECWEATRRRLLQRISSPE